MNKGIPSHILPVIVISQFAGTSLWFAGNAVVSDMILELGLSESFIGFITVAVQLGFIIGTLVFAFLNVADRFSPVKVFLFCALSGAMANLLSVWSDSVVLILISRILTGFFLAGIYPVGMKIASDWHREGLGKALGYLVGALVLGTAFPHFLKSGGSELPWRFVVVSTSVIAAGGGVFLYLTVENGPFRSAGKKIIFKSNTIFRLFRNPDFRSAAFGYFGHMWELYTFWAFVPVMLVWYTGMNEGISLNISLWSFIIIGIGALSCVAGGYLSISRGSKWVAMTALAGSGLCCLLLPFLYGSPVPVFLFILLLWGIFVIPDSPQFSALVARSSDDQFVATGLTIVNSLGFAITIFSIQLVNLLWASTSSVMIFWVILIGPIFGYMSIRKYQTAKADH